jgi:hypothetical protein
MRTGDWAIECEGEVGASGGLRGYFLWRGHTIQQLEMGAVEGRTNQQNCLCYVRQ